MIKKIILLFFIYFCLFQKVCAQPANFIIINQIRGKEICCQSGDDKLINIIKNNKSLSNLKFGWALRYDFLLDSNSLEMFGQNDELGLLLEITPNLAYASGVAYKGKTEGSDWFYAKNAMLIGYTQEERKKLVDHLFSVFKNKVGAYPRFTAGWMVDGWSLQYINQKYKVKLHELTKEQYETDTYTLYGGVFNFPYYPFFTNPLIPGYGQNKLDMIIVRQTISDLSKNYGSSKAYYTSQPNDYLSSKENLNNAYFQQLVADVLSQSIKSRFAVLGFENSFTDQKFLEEYQRQLDYILKLDNEDQIKIFKPSEYADWFSTEFKENPNIILRKDFQKGKENGVLWYFGKKYRARLIIKKDKIILDDLRIYPNILDPYYYEPSMADYSYWIIPYLFDGSQQYRLDKGRLDNKYKELVSDQTVPDIISDPFGLILGEGEFGMEEGQDFISINFHGKNKGKVILAPEEIDIDESLDPAFNTKKQEKINSLIKNLQEAVISYDKHYDLIVKPKDQEALLGYVRDNQIIVNLAKIIKVNGTLRLIPDIEGNQINFLDPIYQPDRSGLSVDTQKSIFYWNNKAAIVGKNPIRLYILPLNSLGRPVQVKILRVESSDIKKLEILYPDDYSYRIKPWFIDIKSKDDFDTKLTLYIDDRQAIADVPVVFIPDCKKTFLKCLNNPQNLIAYIQNILIYR